MTIDQEKKVFSLVATGDSLIYHKLSVLNEPRLLRVRELVAAADVAFNNFESIIRNDKGYPRYKTDPTAWMNSPKAVLDELKWMGFDLFSLANNHSMDYSEDGLMETLRAFDRAGLTHAGTGHNLSEARSPAYLDTTKARIALIAANTRGEDGPAADPRGTIPGRPGLNPLRFVRTLYMTSTDFDTFGSISQKIGLPQPKQGRISFFGNQVQIAEKPGISTIPYKPDNDGNLRSIAEARRNADYVFVSIHNHEKRRPGETYFDDEIEHIAEFVETFSRAAVDAGADAVLGHGTHCLNGIEIYKGRPIFYGLGNFISQSYQSNPKPYDWYEARGLHESLHVPDSTVASRMALVGEAEQRRIRRGSTSVVAKIVYQNKEAAEILLYPIETAKTSPQGGHPLIAEGDSAGEVLERLSRLSKTYGTKIQKLGDVGHIKI